MDQQLEKMEEKRKSKSSSTQQSQPVYYNQKHNSLQRRLLFLHIFHFFRKVKHLIHENQERTGQKQLKTDFLPRIKPQFQSEHMSSTIDHLISGSTHHPITTWHMFLIIAASVKRELLLTFFFALGFFSIRMGIVILLYFAFQSLDKNQSKQTFGYAGAVAFLGFVFILCKQNYILQSYGIFARSRSSIMLLVFKKIMGLSQYTMNQEEIGKLSNILSNDFNLLEFKIFRFYAMLVSPVVYLGSLGILVWWLGVEGLICFGFNFVSVPILIYLSYLMGSQLQKSNVYKDARIRITGDLITNIKNIKIYVWEDLFQKKIGNKRQKEIQELRKLAFARSLTLMVGYGFAVLGGFICFYVKHKTGDLSQSIIFSANILINFLQNYNYYFSYGIDAFFQIKIIFKRFLTIYQIKNICMEEVSPQKINKINSSQTLSSLQNIEEESNIIISFRNFYGSWNLDKSQEEWKAIKGKGTLRKINLDIKKGKMIGLCGKVGSGKSTFIEAILHKIPFYSGDITVNGSISYCQQTAKIFEATLKENIIFGRPFKPEKFQLVLQITDLIKDLNSFEKGQDTMVGEKGITLSGGQKARISLARALYSESDIYLLEDPLSSVSLKVADHIFFSIQKHFRDKTIIISTHLINFLDHCDEIIVMQSGKIKQIIKRYQMQKKQLDNLLQSQINEVEQPNDQLSIDEISITSKKYAISQIKPKLNYQTFIDFLTYSSKWKFIFSILLFIAAQASLSIYFRLFTLYDEQIEKKQTFDKNQTYWIVVGALMLGYMVLLFSAFLFQNLFLLTNNHLLSKDMAMKVSQAKTSYFESHNSGLLINRFSNDLGVLDHSLIYNLQQNTFGISLLIILFINVIYTTLYFLILFAFMIIFMAIVFKYFHRTLIKARQLDLATKNPIFKKINQIIHGLSIIQIFGNQQNYIKQAAYLIDESITANIFVSRTLRIFQFTMEIIGWVIVSLVLLVGIRVIEKPQEYSVAILFLLQMIDNLSRYMSNLLSVQTSMISAARCLQTTQIIGEKKGTNPNDEQFMKLKADFDREIQQQQHSDRISSISSRLPDVYPVVQLRNFWMKYRCGLPYTLKKINFDVNRREKIGIIGHSGSGKSSLLNSLLRLSEPIPGSQYTIHGFDALSLGLHTLRRQFSVVPQEPFLIHGEIRENLDVRNQFKDRQLWEVLKKVYLYDYISSLPKKLKTIITPGTPILSVGQSQLLCLARALLSDERKILILDEATSNLDKKTEFYIQKTLRQCFSSHVVITIAHRLQTIVQYETVMVMNNGQIEQQDHPHRLLEKSHSSFRKMASIHEGLYEQLSRMAKQSYEKNAWQWMFSKVSRKSTKKY